MNGQLMAVLEQITGEEQAILDGRSQVSPVSLYGQPGFCH